jgi:hypothetical protein
VADPAPGWRQLAPAEIDDTWEVSRPVIAFWAGPGDASLALYEDGLVEVEGDGFPVELVPYVSLAWHGWLRGKGFS